MSIRPDSKLVADIVVSANCEPRRGALKPDMLLLHYTGMLSAKGAIAWLARPESKVSCHYVIDVDGRVTQMVPEAMRAWHAGVSNWAGETDINSLSIGIEIQNPGHELGYQPFPEAQMQAVAALGLDIVQRHRISPHRVLAHSDVAPLRKIDPGEKFNWRYLHACGLGAWTEPEQSTSQPVDPLRSGDEGAAVKQVQQLLTAYGYAVPVSGHYCDTTRRVVTAFQRHYRPTCIDGIADRSTLRSLVILVGQTGRAS